MKRSVVCIFLVIMLIGLFSGCAQEANIQITFFPVITAEPAPTGIPLPSRKITDETFTADIDSDGAEETITFNSTEIEIGGGVDYLTVMTVSGNSGTYTENIEGSIYAFSYIIRVPSGKVCLLIGLEGYVDFSSEIYSFDGIKPVNLCGLGHVTGVSGTDITVEGPIDALGTWHYSRVYKLKDDLSLEPGECQIIMDDKEPLHTKKKLPVEFLKDEAYEKGYIDIGEDIIPVSTDGRSYLKFRLEDGSEGRILFVRADGQYENGILVSLIGNISEFEYLENIEYTDMYY